MPLNAFTPQTATGGDATPDDYSATEDYPANEPFVLTVPTGGPFDTINGEVQSDAVEWFRYPAGRDAADRPATFDAAEFALLEVVSKESGATSDFVPHIFEVSGTGEGSSGGSPYMFQSFVAEQDGFYLPEPTEYDLYRNQVGTGRVSAHIQLNSSTTGGGTIANPNELWRQYLQKASRSAGSTTDVAVTNDNGGPYIASVPVQLVAGATYYLYHVSNTGYFRNSDTARVKFTKINTDPQLELPTSFSNLGDWNGVDLNNVVANGMLVGGGSGSAGTGAPSGAFTGSCKITTIGKWCQQDFLTANAPGTVVGERFSRQSFNADAGPGNISWTSWYGQ